MEDGPGKIKIVPDHFQVSTSSDVTPQSKTSSVTKPCSNNSSSPLWSGRKLRSAASMFKSFSLRRLSWGSSTDGEEKVGVTVAELELLKLELADLEEREAHLKAQLNHQSGEFCTGLEHVDEILRSARLCGYLHIRTRWAALPGEPPPIDDIEVDDWLPRFVVLHGSCIFFYLLCTDLSPQDSTPLSDIVEVGPLPSFRREDDSSWFAFYISTCQGLRYECSSVSKVQVDSWLTALRTDRKSDSDTKRTNGSSEKDAIQTSISKLYIGQHLIVLPKNSQH